MKLLCPHCGLRGTAETTLFERKAMCPGCGKVFRITEQLVIGGIGHGREVIQSVGSDADLLDTQAVAVNDGNSDLLSPEPDSEPKSSLMSQEKCSRCGFTLSGSFIRIIDEVPVCLACAG